MTQTSLPSRRDRPRPGRLLPSGEGAHVGAQAEGGTAVLVSLGQRLRRADRDTVWLLSITLALVGIGLVMVLSSSAVEQFAAGNVISDKFLKQALTAVIGVPAMLVAMRLPVSFWRKAAGPMLLVAIVIQSLVFSPLGYSVGENRAWIAIGGATLQPAEITKVALAVWLAVYLGRRRVEPGRLWTFAWPLLLVVGASVGLVIAGKDLGTTMVLGALVLGAMWFGRVPMNIVLGTVGAAIVGIVGIALTSSSRVERMTSFFNGTCDYEVLCWQTSHGLYALAAGGLFGKGLGNSSAKWSWLPEADNDFIFAIIGEELGLVGALTVIALFAAMFIVLLRIVAKTRDPFSKTVVGAVLVWLLFQTFVNIAVVLGLLPVLGVPLPFISSGGSALVTTLLAVGIVLSASRGSAQEADRERGAAPAAARRAPRAAQAVRSAAPAAPGAAPRARQARAAAARVAAPRAAEPRTAPARPAPASPAPASPQTRKPRPRS